jgi:short-subunit dehydrogenase
MKSLHNKTVFITGASRGIGLAMARAFGQSGATVLMLARQRDTLEREARALQAEGLRVWWHMADVTDGASVHNAVAAAMAAHGRIDVLVNNAGQGHQRPFLQQSMAQARGEMDTNYFGVLHMLHAVLPHMLAADSGVVLNVSSVCGMVGTPSMANYSASKAALNLLIHSLRGELAHTRIRLGLLVPGHTATELGRSNRFDRVPINDPVRVAGVAVKAVLNPRPEWFASSDRMLYRLGRLSPRLAEWIMAGTTRAVMHEMRATPSSTGRSND